MIEEGKRVRLTHSRADISPTSQGPYFLSAAFVALIAFPGLVRNLLGEYARVIQPPARDAEDSQADRCKPCILHVQLLAPLPFKRRLVEQLAVIYAHIGDRAR